MKAYITSTIASLALLHGVCGHSQTPSSPAGGAQTQPASSTAPENPAPPPSAPAKLSAAELEKLVMPIALHPDPLIAVILPASVYPIEIVQAARFVKDTNNIPKVDEQPWDDNVKELAKFPDMIAKMDTDLEWTTQLGQAFLEQPKELMDTIQALRGKAQKAGTLQTTPQQIVTVTNIVVYETNSTQIVTVTNQVVQVAPSNPQVVYVPTYPPTVYYPPPGYVYNPVAPLVTFGVGMAWGAILANNCNWGHGNVDVDIDRNVNRNVNRNTDRSSNRANSRSSSGGSRQWQPDQNRMRSSGSPQTAKSQQARGWSGSSPQGSQRATGAGNARGSQGASPGAGGARPSQGSANRATPSSSGSRSPSAAQSAGNRSAQSSSMNRSSGGGSSSAFNGVSSGSSARSSASRGSASRGGGGGARGGGGGRGGGGRR